MTDHLIHIQALLQKSNYTDEADIKELPSSGSNRIYYRLTFPNGSSILAAFNPDINENIAWYSFTEHFRNRKLPVPEIYARDESYTYFLLQDLGSLNLFDIISGGITDEVLSFYKQVLDDLIRFQVDGIQQLDMDVAYPVKEFDQKSIHWDLNYFKYYFIKPHELDFDESKLEKDFIRFSDVLLKADSSFFMYRDFQARNILIKDNKPWFIDFQGGRIGPLQYDLVSLLYQAKANLPTEIKDELYAYYLLKLEKKIPEISSTFNKYYTYFIYFRLMQVFGAYGFRGLIQRKGHFLSSIPFAIQNLRDLLLNTNLTEDFPELGKIFMQIIELKNYPIKLDEKTKLTVRINSFSYKKTSYPIDYSDNGGGFVFDCRSLPNPGRIKSLRDYNGTQEPIINYLQEKKEVATFLDNAFSLVGQAVDNYLERGFSNLEVSFGCTGGKHRSVYSVEQLSAYLKKYGDQIVIQKRHIQQDG